MKNLGTRMIFEPGSIALAVDTKDIRSAVALVNEVRDYVSIIKLGLEFFIANGPQGVELVYKETGIPIFLDLKLFDIPNTIKGAVESVLVMESVHILTLSLLGGQGMLCAAVNANKNNQILLAGVTVLTSMSILSEVVITSRPALRKAIEEMDMPVEFIAQEEVLYLASLAWVFGMRAVVCSAHEAPYIKRQFKEMIAIVPGIRSANAERHDQRRVATPGEAIKNGADILVVGREITDSKDRRGAAQRIATEVRLALGELD